MESFQQVSKWSMEQTLTQVIFKENWKNFLKTSSFREKTTWTMLTTWQDITLSPTILQDSEKQQILRAVSWILIVSIFMIMIQSYILSLRIIQQMLFPFLILLQPKYKEKIFNKMFRLLIKMEMQWWMVIMIELFK